MYSYFLAHPRVSHASGVAGEQLEQIYPNLYKDTQVCTKCFNSFINSVLMKDQENISEIEQYVIDFIRKLRLQKEITQDGLASILQVGKSFVSNVESLNHRAKYNLTHINTLADYFNKAPGDFLPTKAFANIKIKTGNEKKKINKEPTRGKRK